MQNARSLPWINVRFPAVPIAGWPIRSGALILVGALSCVLSLWCQGCVPSSQTPHNSPASSADPGPSGPVTTPHESAPAGSRSAMHEPAVNPDRETREQTTRLPERSRHASLPSYDRKPDQVTDEKLPGYRVPAEYLFIPSRHYPDATVAVMLPADYHKNPKKKYPLVIAFGGAGECAKPPEKGALAWLRYYKTDEAAEAVERGKLVVGDFRGLVTDKQLKDFNRSLKHRPYLGVILACPSSPLLWARSGVDIPEYESFVMQELIPELQKRYRTDPDRIGVDGVSMGGARSMYYGFKYPAVFASVGSVQGAFGPYFDTYQELIKENREILANRAIQLVTSDGDGMARSVEHMHTMLQGENIPHRYLVLTGPHDYIFNQGPGALALLLFHNHALTAGPLGPVK